MSAPGPVRVAQVGLGEWGPNLLRNLGANAACRVVALCDRDKGRLAEFAKAHPAARVCGDIAAVAADSEIDAVVLATPAGLHAEHVRLMLDAGKDVLVEKPLALELGAARELVSRAESAGRVLMVGHTFLFNSAVRRVKEELDAGRLGRLQLILAQRLSLGRIREDCNALWNLAPHDISILLYWVSEMPLSVSARGMAFHEGRSREDFALCVIEFPGRVMASVQVSWMNPVKVREMTLVGSGGMLLYDDVSTEAPLTLYDRRLEEVARPGGPNGSLEEFQLQIRRGAESRLPVPRREPLAEEVDHFLNCVRTREKPIGSGVEALRIMSVLEACDRSMKLGGRAVTPEAV